YSAPLINAQTEITNTLICERIKNFAPKLYSMFCSPGAGQRLYFVRMSLVAERYNYSALMARYPVNDDCNANNKKAAE
ncbi:hypothetical protein, partial [Cronobacter sakazakii]|uniref:hypothetical protein n=1 Tax=Cronobacter sakazakii TaxID=28141 RepID=UPI001F481D9E